MQKISKLFYLLLLGSILCCVNFTKTYAQSTCETAEETDIGFNSATNTPNWYSYVVPEDMKYLIISTEGLTDVDTYLELYSTCNNLLTSNDDYEGRQSRIRYDVSNYRGDTLLINCRLYSGTGGSFSWLLSGETEEGKEMSYNIAIDDISMWYGEKIGIETAKHPVYPLQFWIEGEDNGVIQIEGDSIIGLSKAGEQQVTAIIFDDNSVNRGQTTFTITNQVDPSGKKKGVIYNYEDLAVNQGDSITLQATTNSDIAIQYSIISGNDLVSIIDNTITINAETGEVQIEISIEETEEYTGVTDTITVSISPYKNGIPFVEYKALEAFYNATNGDNWGNNENWFTEESVSEWRGVTTEDRLTTEGEIYSVVTELYYYYNNLSGTLPIEIGDLSNLKRLTIYGEGLTSVPHSINNLKKLESLNLGYNSIQNFPSELNLPALTYLDLSSNDLVSIPNQIDSLVSIVTLDFAYNEITSIPSEFGTLESLENLNLSNNRINEIPAELGGLSSLKNFNVRRNNIYIFPSELTSWSNLEHLEISGNNFSELPSEISSYTNLLSINLASNQFTELPLAVCEISSLEAIYLDYNKLTTLPSEIGNLTNLSVLELYSNRLSSLPDEIGNLTALTLLELVNNQLSSIPSSLANCVNLESLTIQNNQFQHFPSALGSLTNLRYFYFEYNQFTFDDLDGYKTILDNIHNLDYSPQRSVDYVMSQDIDNKTTTLTVTDASENNTYIWYKNDEEIANEHSAYLTISYEDNIDNNFQCEIKNSVWTDLTLYTNVYEEKGELVTLVVENVPSNTPEGVLIYAMPSSNNDNDFNNQNWPLTYNEASSTYELTLPKGYNDIEFTFALKKHETYSEVDENISYVVRNLDLSTFSGVEIIADINEWLNIPVPSNTCANSYTISSNETYTMGDKITWYNYTATSNELLKITTPDAYNGSNIEVYTSCGGELLDSRLISWSGNSVTVELEEGEEVVIMLSTYDPNKDDYAFNFMLESKVLKSYIIPSIPSNTPEGVSITANGTINDIYWGYQYNLEPIEGSDAYVLKVQEDLGEVDFSFILNNYEGFIEVDAAGEIVSRTINPTDDATGTTLEPIIAWSEIANPENNCETPITISEDGSYLKGIGEQWYLYTAPEDVQVTLSSNDADDNTGAKIALYSSCGGMLTHEAESYYANTSLVFALKKGESVYIKWDTYFSEETYSYEWTLESQVSKTYIVDGIPHNTPAGWNVYAIGTMNNYELDNKDYPLVYNEENDYYEITFAEELDSVEFYFVLEGHEITREVDPESNFVTRNIDLNNTETGTHIYAIIEWNKVPQFASDCSISIALNAADTLLNGEEVVWYEYTATQDAVIQLSTLEMTNIDTYVQLKATCDDYITLDQNDDYDGTLQTYLEYRLNAGETVKIKWDTFNTGSYQWSFNVVEVQNQTIDSLNIGLGTLTFTDILTDQGFPLTDIEVLSGDATVEDSTITTHSITELELRLVSIGDSTYYYDLDTIVTLQVALVAQSFETDFFDDITEEGVYVMPEFVTDQGQTLLTAVVSGNASISNDSLFVTGPGEIEVFLYIQKGEYYNEFGVIYTLQIEGDIPTSLEEDLSKSISIFPNPASEIVNLQLPNLKGKVELSILSTSGQILRNETMTDTKALSLDISTLQTGVYILRISTEKGIGVKRLIVK